MNRVLLAVLLVAGVATAADLAAVKAEPNLEKRSGAALKNADRALKDARQAYNKGELQPMQSLVAEVRESVLLAMESLKETGKNPRRSPKWFKRAEIQTRDLLKKLDAFGREMDAADRPMLDETKTSVQQVHEELLRGVVEGKK